MNTHAPKSESPTRDTSGSQNGSTKTTDMNNFPHAAAVVNGASGTPFGRVVSRLTGVQSSGGELIARCPAHDDHTPSLTIREASDGAVLLHCFAGCSVENIVATLGLTLSDLFPAKEKTRRIVATYDYVDEHGVLLFQVVRYEPKAFQQRRPDGMGGWVWNLKGVRHVLYHLPELAHAETIFLAEGEKDSDRLRALGLVAATSPGGVRKWREEYSESLRGKHVVILPDNDEPGEEHARTVAASVFPVAASVRIVRLPDLPPKGDVSDWLDVYTKDDLLSLVSATSVLTEGDGLLLHPGKKENPWEHVKSAPAFLAEEEKEFHGLAKDLLAPGAISLLAAPRGLGKTQTAHALAVALSEGGVFRGEQLRKVKVLIVDRDNPEAIIKKRLRAWGATKAEGLHVLTRQHAPDLKDKSAWEAFPINDYDVLVIDSVGASTEGVTEKEGRQTTEILATVLDLARKGIAILLLTNTIKDGTNLKGRGEWADRADIIYEIRDTTSFTPSGKKPWWAELPEAGESGWADRASRRKGQVDFRLGFICSKFRLGPEPEPFCLELHLPEGEPWTVTDVTETLIETGIQASERARRESEISLKKAEDSLATLVLERSRQNCPILKTEAEKYLKETCGLKRARARELLENSPAWRLENRRQAGGKQAAWYLLGKIDGNGNEFSSPPKSTTSGTPVVAVQAETGRQLSPIEKPLFDAGSMASLASSPSPPEKNEYSATNDYEEEL